MNLPMPSPVDTQVPAKSSESSFNPVVNSNAVTKRLQQELTSMMMSSGGDSGVSAFPAGDSLYNWIGTISGPKGTVYDSLTYRLTLTFTSEYPFKPPVVKFETPCFHPNVDGQGNICLDILKEKWSAAYSVGTILQSVQSLLGDANVDSPLNVHAANMWDGNQDEYKEMVLKTYKSNKKQ